MAHLTFDVYKLNKDNAVLDQTFEYDTEATDVAEIQRINQTVRELKKEKNVVVGVNNELAAWELGKPSPRGKRTTVPADVVVFVHEQHVKDGVEIDRIPFRIFDKFEGLEIKTNVVKAILNQERDTDVTGIDDLREAAIALKPKRGNQKHSDETKAEWVRKHVEDNMSGSAIAKEYGLNSATVNGHLKKMGVQKNKRGRSTNDGAVAKEVE